MTYIVFDVDPVEFVDRIVFQNIGANDNSEHVAAKEIKN